MNMVKHRTEPYNDEPHLSNQNTDNSDQYQKILGTVEYPIPRQTFYESMSRIHRFSQLPFIIANIRIITRNRSRVM